jgi:hypothetical protein
MTRTFSMVIIPPLAAAPRARRSRPGGTTRSTARARAVSPTGGPRPPLRQPDAAAGPCRDVTLATGYRGRLDRRTPDSPRPRARRGSVAPAGAARPPDAPGSPPCRPTPERGRRLPQLADRPHRVVEIRQPQGRQPSQRPEAPLDIVADVPARHDHSSWSRPQFSAPMPLAVNGSLSRDRAARLHGPRARRRPDRAGLPH